MSLNRREEILGRMFEILDGMKAANPGLSIQTVKRNRGLLDNDMRTALVLLDGDETTQLVGERRGRQKMSPVLVRMKPQVFAILKIKKPQNEGVGTDLNALRAAIIKAFADDAQLLALIGPNGDIAYDGCETDLKTGMSLEGQVQMSFSLLTVLNPYSN